MGFFESDAFSTANLVITGRVPLTLRGAAMIEDSNACEIDAELFGLAAGVLEGGARVGVDQVTREDVLEAVAQ